MKSHNSTAKSRAHHKLATKVGRNSIKESILGPPTWLDCEPEQSYSEDHQVIELLNTKLDDLQASLAPGKASATASSSCSGVKAAVLAAVSIRPDVHVKRKLSMSCNKATTALQASYHGSPTRTAKTRQPLQPLQASVVERSAAATTPGALIAQSNLLLEQLQHRKQGTPAARDRHRAAVTAVCSSLVSSPRHQGTPKNRSIQKSSNSCSHVAGTSSLPRPASTDSLSQLGPASTGSVSSSAVASSCVPPAADDPSLGAVRAREAQLQGVIQLLQQQLQASQQAELATKQRNAELHEAMRRGGRLRVELQQELVSAKHTAGHAGTDMVVMKRRVECLQRYLHQEKENRLAAERKLQAAEQQISHLQLQVEVRQTQVAELQHCVRTAGITTTPQAWVDLKSALTSTEVQLRACQHQLTSSNLANTVLQQQVMGLQSALEQLYVSKIGKEQLQLLTQQLGRQQPSSLSGPTQSAAAAPEAVPVACQHTSSGAQSQPHNTASSPDMLATESLTVNHQRADCVGASKPLPPPLLSLNPSPRMSACLPDRASAALSPVQTSPAAAAGQQEQVGTQFRQVAQQVGSPPTANPADHAHPQATAAAAAGFQHLSTPTHCHANMPDTCTGSESTQPPHLQQTGQQAIAVAAMQTNKQEMLQQPRLRDAWSHASNPEQQPQPHPVDVVVLSARCQAQQQQAPSSSGLIASQSGMPAPAVMAQRSTQRTCFIQLPAPSSYDASSMISTSTAAAPTSPVHPTHHAQQTIQEELHMSHMSCTSPRHHASGLLIEPPSASGCAAALAAGQQVHQMQNMVLTDTAHPSAAAMLRDPVVAEPAINGELCTAEGSFACWKHAQPPKPATLEGPLVQLSVAQEAVAALAAAAAGVHGQALSQDSSLADDSSEESSGSSGGSGNDDTHQQPQDAAAVLLPPKRHASAGDDLHTAQCLVKDTLDSAVHGSTSNQQMSVDDEGAVQPTCLQLGALANITQSTMLSSWQQQEPSEQGDEESASASTHDHDQDYDHQDWLDSNCIQVPMPRRRSLGAVRAAARHKLQQATKQPNTHIAASARLHSHHPVQGPRHCHAGSPNMAAAVMAGSRALPRVSSSPSICASLQQSPRQQHCSSSKVSRSSRQASCSPSHSKKSTHINKRTSINCSSMRQHKDASLSIGPRSADKDDSSSEGSVGWPAARDRSSSDKQPCQSQLTARSMPSRPCSPSRRGKGFVHELLAAQAQSSQLRSPVPNKPKQQAHKKAVGILQQLQLQHTQQHADSDDSSCRKVMATGPHMRQQLTAEGRLGRGRALQSSSKHCSSPAAVYRATPTRPSTPVGAQQPAHQQRTDDEDTCSATSSDSAKRETSAGEPSAAAHKATCKRRAPVWAALCSNTHSSEGSD